MLRRITGGTDPANDLPPNFFSRATLVRFIMLRPKIGLLMFLGETMEERRSHQRRQGPIRLEERRKQEDAARAAIMRGPDRRRADRRIGIDRRRHTINGNPQTTATA